MTRINDEIFVAFEGEIIKLGIIEFDEDWFPFTFDPSQDYYEKDDESIEDEGEEDIEEDDEEEGISDTWIQDVESEKEDGEIRQDEDENCVDGTTVVGESIQGDVLSPASTIPARVSSKEVQEPFGEMQQAAVIPQEAAEATPWKPRSKIKYGKISLPQPRGEIDGSTQPVPDPNAPIHTQDCFGIFSSFNGDGLPFTPAQTNNNIIGSLGKRKRCDNPRATFPLNSITPMASLAEPDPAKEESDPTKEVYRPPLQKNIEEIVTPPSTIDLNKKPDVAPNYPTSSIQSSSSLELARTAEVGKEVGFEIELGNPILREAMGVTGEQNIPQ